MHPVLLRIFQDAVTHLAGQPVKVEIRDPNSQKARSCCCVNQDGITTIYKRPSWWKMDREAFWRVYLHECAHAVKLAKRFARSDGNVLPIQRDDDFKDLLMSMHYTVQELQADTWVLKWRIFAGDGSMMERLL